MRLLVFGANGMLGHKILEVLGESFEVWGTVRNQQAANVLRRTLAPERLVVDVSAERVASAVEVLDRLSPDVIVNCIAVGTRRSEDVDARVSRAVNARFPHQLASWCSVNGSRLIHFSTDAVFSGTKGRYREDDVADPVEAYGRTKLLGEVRGPGVVTLRTSMIGWELSGHSGFLEWLATQVGKTVYGYTNVLFSGLSTASLARTVRLIVSDGENLDGIFHVASEPISKLELIRSVTAYLHWPIRIEPVPEPRRDHSLDSSLFRRSLPAWREPTWGDMVAEVAEEREKYLRWRGEA